MTNNLVSAAHDHYTKNVKIHPRSRGEPLIGAEHAITSFIAGADWQREQPLATTSIPVRCGPRLVPRMTPDTMKVPDMVIGWDLAGPGSDHSIESVVMSKVQWDAHCKQMDDLRANREHWRQQVGKLESGARALQDRTRALETDNAKLEKERDDWHHAYDKLVRNIVHGREFEKAIDDMSTFGTGVVHVDAAGGVMHVNIKEMCDTATEATGGFTAQGEAEARQPTLRDVAVAAENASAIAYDAGIDFTFTISTRIE